MNTPKNWENLKNVQNLWSILKTSKIWKNTQKLSNILKTSTSTFKLTQTHKHFKQMLNNSKTSKICKTYQTFTKCINNFQNTSKSMKPLKNTQTYSKRTKYPKPSQINMFLQNSTTNITRNCGDIRLSKNPKMCLSITEMGPNHFLGLGTLCT